MADEEQQVEQPGDVDAGQTDTADAPADTDALQDNGQAVESAGQTSGYRQRQVGMIGIICIIVGVASLADCVDGAINDDLVSIINGAVRSIIYCLIGLGFLWFQVEDKGDHLMVTSGPCRWLLCGWGKEKVQYSEIRDFQTTKTCLFAEPGSHALEFE